MSSEAEDPCRRCGTRHVLKEFAIGQLVRVRVHDSRRKPIPKHAALNYFHEVGEVVEWGQYGGPLWYRVDFGTDDGGDRIRCNYDPCELEAARPQEVPLTMKHRLYKTGDDGAPDAIKDRNSEVVLSLCKVCNQAEGELAPTCPGVRRAASAHSPGTALCAAMLDAFDKAARPSGVRAIAIVTEPVPGGSNGVAFSGYEDAGDADVLVDLIAHVRAILRANGKDLSVITVPKTGAPVGERS